MSVIAEIKLALGAYTTLLRNELRDQVMAKSETLMDFRTVMSDAQDGNEVGIPVTNLSEVVQSFQNVVTPKGNFTIGAEKVTQRRHKINVQIDPDTIVGEWEGYMYDEKVSRKEMPLVKYIMNKLMSKIEEDREEQMIMKGVYTAPTAGVANNANQTVDGIIRISDVAATAGKYTKFAMGAITAGNEFEYLEQFVANIPAKFRHMPLDVYISPDLLLAYNRDKRDTFKYWQDITDRLDFTQARLKARLSLSGSQRVMATMPGNFVRIIHKNPGATNIDVDTSPYIVLPFADWHESFGIGDFRYFWSNDQA